MTDIAAALWGTPPANTASSPSNTFSAPSTDEDLASRLFDANKTSEAKTGRDESEQSQKELRAGTSVESRQLGDALFGMSQAQVPSSYPEIAELYDGLQEQERLEDLDVDTEAYQTSRDALQDFAISAGMGRGHVQTIISAARDAMNNPATTVEALEAKATHCEKVLREVWRGDYERNLQIAKTEAKRLMNRVPHSREVLEMGAGSNPDLIKVLAEAGRARRR